MSKKEDKLKSALEKMLALANDKLALAKSKGKGWDIKHYENDIRIIEEQLKTDELFNECKKRFGSTLEKLKD